MWIIAAYKSAFLILTAAITPFCQNIQLVKFSQGSACNQLAKGLSVEEIAEIVELTVEEVRQAGQRL